jgi:MoaE-MoaD fusion protein
MRVRVVCFGVLKDWLGAGTVTVELAEGATVAALLDVLRADRASGPLSGMAVSVNAEFVTAAHALIDGDEVGLLPPVSGGSGLKKLSIEETQPVPHIALTREPIDTEQIVSAAKRGEDGAVVVFDGIVRNNTRGRKTLHLDYEAYEEMAEKQMRELAAEARQRFAIRHLTVGETSVLIVVASAHRAAAFDACRWLIDTLKKQVPIWKKETFHDGAVWADGEPFPEGLAISSEAAHEAN